MHSDIQIISFAEKVITLLDTGKFTTTYKYAVLIGLMDLCIESDINDDRELTITTAMLTKKVIALYWKQTKEYDENIDVLLAGRKQAEIITKIVLFKNKHPRTSLHSFLTLQKPEYIKLFNIIEKKLIEMPLPRVQKFGNNEDRFIYDINWTDNQETTYKKSLFESVKLYQINQPSKFDNNIVLKKNVCSYFKSLNGLLRPMIKQSWIHDVAKMNNLPESKLEGFLFGNERVAISKFSDDLLTLQNGKCFYCDKSISSNKVQVDHFIPWSRIPNDALANLVASDEKCNNNKRDHIPNPHFLDKWLARNQQFESDLNDIALTFNWPLNIKESQNIAQSTYLRLDQSYEYWYKVDVFEKFAGDIKDLFNQTQINTKIKSNIVTIQVPFYLDLPIACGHFKTAEHQHEETIEIEDKYGKLNQHHFIATASGNSMNGGKSPIMDGDYLLLEQITPENAGSLNNQIIALETQDDSGFDQYLLRQINKTKNGYELIAKNPEYKPMIANDETKPFARLIAVLKVEDVFG